MDLSEGSDYRRIVIQTLLEGLPPERHHQCRTLFSQLIDRDQKTIKATLPLSRRAIEYIHPADTREVCDALIAFYAKKADGLIASGVYHGLDDPEAELLSDLCGAFVRHWHDTHE